MLSPDLIWIMLAVTSKHGETKDHVNERLYVIVSRSAVDKDVRQWETLVKTIERKAK